MNAIKDFNSCVVIGRRWFQRSAGNTYHSVTVNVDGVNIGHVSFAYGYGDGYKQTALEILQAAGYYQKTGASLPSGANKNYNDFFTDTINFREKFVFTVSDVERKKDL